MNKIHRIPMKPMTYATENEGMAQVVEQLATKMNEIIDVFNQMNTIQCPSCDGTKFEVNGICSRCNGKGTTPNE